MVLDRLVFKKKEILKIYWKLNYIQFDFENSLAHPAIKIPFHPEYISNDGIFDTRYFTELFIPVVKNFPKKLSFSKIVFYIPHQFVLKVNYETNNLPNHQQEREIILKIQQKFHIQITEYEYYFSPEQPYALAVPKNIVQNLNYCFEIFKFKIEIFFDILGDNGFPPSRE